MQKDSTKRKRASNSHATTKKRAIRRIPAALRARALAIINSDAYDEDTRASIRFQLKTNYDDLADMVKRAEQGETICDTVMVSTELRNAARKVIALFEVPSVPDFLTDALMDALSAAAELKHVALWKPKDDAEVIDIKALSTLFALTPMFSLKPKKGVEADKQRVIKATAEILRNPQTPSDLFQGVAEFVTEAVNKKNQEDLEPGQPELLHTAPILTVLLDSYPEDELMGAVITARKEGQS